MSPRVTKHPDVRRDELMDAALRLAVDPGWDSFSIDQLTGAVGVAKGTFYYHFGSKTHLLEDLCRRFGDELFARLEAALPTFRGTAAEQLKQLVAVATDWKLANLDDAMASVPLLYRPENFELRHRMFEAWLGRCRPLFAPLVARGHDDGSFDVDDPEATTEMLLSLWLDASTRLFDRALNAADAEEFVDIVLRGQRALTTAVDRLLGATPGTFAVPQLPEAVRSLREPFLAALGLIPQGNQR